MDANMDANIDLKLTLELHLKWLRGLEAAAEICRLRTALRMLDHARTYVGGVASNPDQPDAYHGLLRPEVEKMFAEIYPNPKPVLRARLEAQIAEIKNSYPGVEFES